MPDESLAQDFRRLVERASLPSAANDSFLADLAKVTGYGDVPTMLARFRRLAGLDAQGAESRT